MGYKKLDKFEKDVKKLVDDGEFKKHYDSVLQERGTQNKDQLSADYWQVLSRIISSIEEQEAQEYFTKKEIAKIFNQVEEISNLKIFKEDSNGRSVDLKSVRDSVSCCTGDLKKNLEKVIIQFNKDVKGYTKLYDNARNYIAGRN